ncbi:MAG TPA: LPS export ABC transporter periplasmic protein LptC [Stenomitos sp.]
MVVDGMKKLLLAACILAIGLAAWWGAGLVTRWSRPRPQDAPPPPAIEFRGVDLVEFSEGAKVWDLNAESVHYDPDSKVANLKGIQAHFWEGGRVVSTAVSPTAVLDSRTHDLRMGGGIRVDSALANTQVRADQVIWRAASQSLQASGSVTFQRGPSRLMGPTLWADRSLMKVRMGSPVRALIGLEPIVGR